MSLPKSRRQERKTLNAEEAKRLIAVARDSDLEALLVLALTTAMRRGELLGLKWDDIDFDKQILQIRRSLNRVGGYGFVVSDPKTKTSIRRIMLTPLAVDALKKHKQLQEQRRAKLGAKWQDMGLVFCNFSGGYWDPRHVLEKYQKLLDQAQLPKMRFHDLRHSAATLLLSMGVHPKLVQDLLGHSTIGTTMDIYSHVLPVMQQEVVNKMGLVFQEEDDLEEDE